MKRKTYEILYDAHLGVVNKADLQEARLQETDPFYQNLFDLILEKHHIGFIPWNEKTFTSDFHNATPRTRLDETFFTFILRVVAIIKEERYRRTFRKPESHDAIMAWEGLLRQLLICSIALLYNIEWTLEQLFNELEPALMTLLNDGDPLALRRLLTQLGVPPAQDHVYEAETAFGTLNFLHTGQYSGFYWRFLHWMAEAGHHRPESMTVYKTQWKNLLLGPLYRTLRCGICMIHFRVMINELKPQIEDPHTDLRTLFFDIHNRVHTLRREEYVGLKEPNYTESEFQKDSEFYVKAL